MCVYSAYIFGGSRSSGPVSTNNGTTASNQPNHSSTPAAAPLPVARPVWAPGGVPGIYFGP